MSADSRDVANQVIWSLARRCRPGEVVVVGVATPIAATAALLARELLVDDLTVIVAASVDPPPHDIAEPMLEAGAVAEISAGSLTQAEVLDQIQRGRVDLQFVSPAQVDGRGRLNTSRVRKEDGEMLRLPGGLATGDIAVLVGRLVAYRIGHSPRFLAETVDFTTGVGHDHDPGWRRRRGLPGDGVGAIVTDKAVLDWDPAQRSMVLRSVHPGHDVGEVVANCGFRLEVPDEVPTSESPPPDALELLDEVLDPHGIRVLETRDGRPDALATLTRLRNTR